MPICRLTAALLLLAAPALAREVSGAVTLRERIALPPDTVVSVEAVAPDGSVTRAEIAPGASQPPYAFALTAPDTALTLTASIRAGGRLWATDPTRVTAGAPTDTGFLLAVAAEPAGFASLLACGDALMALGYRGDSAILSRGRDTAILPPRDGGFADATGDTAVTGDGTAFRWQGEDLPPCNAFPDPAITETTFRGNEPGFVLVTGPEGARLSTQDGTDLQAAALPALRTGDSLNLFPPGMPDLALSPGPCVDTMTGMPYPWAIEVRGDDFMLTGCGGEPAALLQGDWRVVEIDGAPVPDAVSPTLSFTDGAVSGRTGCNRYGGPVMLTAEGLAFGGLRATKMACPPPAMEVERAFLAAMPAVTRFDIDLTGDLVLLAGDRPAMRARR